MLNTCYSDKCIPSFRYKLSLSWRTLACPTTDDVPPERWHTARAHLFIASLIRSILGCPCLLNPRYDLRGRISDQMTIDRGDNTRTRDSVSSISRNFCFFIRPISLVPAWIRMQTGWVALVVLRCDRITSETPRSRSPLLPNQVMQTGWVALVVLRCDRITSETPWSRSPLLPNQVTLAERPKSGSPSSSACLPAQYTIESPTIHTDGADQPKWKI